MREFKPTYLCIKQHSTTGLKYLCKTTESHEDMLAYKGSGKYWKDHIKKHGKEQVETIWYCLFYDKEELEKFALMCSDQWNIVESKEWANLILENGLAGGSVKGKRHSYKKHKLTALTGKKSKPHSIESRKKLALALIGKNKGKSHPQSDKTRIKISLGLKGIPKPQADCPICHKSGGISAMKRWHFDKCRESV